MICDRCKRDYPNEQIGTIKDSSGCFHTICKDCYLQLRAQQSPNQATPNNPISSTDTYSQSTRFAQSTKYCHHCGNLILKDAVVCPCCGCKTYYDQKKDETSSLSSLALFFAFIFPVAIIGLILGIVGVCTQKNKRYKNKCCLAIFVSLFSYFIDLLILYLCTEFLPGLFETILNFFSTV